MRLAAVLALAACAKMPQPRPAGPVVQVTGLQGSSAVAVAPGARSIRVEGLTIPIAPEGAGPAQVAIGRGIAWVAAGRTSLVQGERMQLSASVPAHWSVTPASCGETDAGATFTAAAPGACTLTASAGGASASLSVVVRSRGGHFPLHRAGRSLADARGAPFLIKGEAAWLALVNLSEAEQETYFADRAGKGFNLIEISLVNHSYTGPPEPVPPADRHGDLPFLRADDFSAPSGAYFDRAVDFVRRAADHGLAVLVAPLYLGFDGGDEGWWHAIQAPANTREVMRGFGRYLGARFGKSPNLIWLAGGDFAPPAGSEGEARYLEFVRGMKAAGATQPWTGHWNFDHQGGISLDERAFAREMDLDGVYQYASPYRFTGRAYAAGLPVFLLESAYEHEHARSPLLPERKAWWWAMTSGAAGIVWGNNFLWMCETLRGAHPAVYAEGDGAVSTWAAELDSPGTSEAIHLHQFFEGLAWDRLTPQPQAGRGWRASRITVAAAPGLLVAYVPPDGAGPRRFTLDLSRLHAPLRARWFDPSSGVSLPFSAVPGADVGFETPGANASGVNDWALSIEGSMIGPSAPWRIGD
jgi:hypothetical protein